jgi:hypothetical protein
MTDSSTSHTKTRHYLAFDIEIAKMIPERSNDWNPYRPLGISCAATLASNGSCQLWYGKTPTGEFADQMSREEVVKVVEHLGTEVESGKTILTWNGLGFDFDILAEESGLHDTCKELALNHVDMMFHILCEQGYPLSLDKAAKGMGLPGKPKGMRGELMPELWLGGKKQEVLDYVSGDVETTLLLAQEVEKRHRLHWISDRGSHQFLYFPKGWFTVREALDLPEPDTTWMSRPWPRIKFAGWLT